MKYLSLVGINLVYASVSLFTKWTSMHAFLSWQYVAGMCGAVGMLGVYAVLWQQVLKRMPVTDAYMFKGLSLVFIMLFSVLIYGEGITWCNAAGALIIIVGITLYAWLDRKEAGV